MVYESLAVYQDSWRKLRQDRSNRWPRVVMGRAPHKPCLLLAVVDMIALGIVNTNLIPLVLDLRELMGPGDRDLWPSLESVAWHGRVVFRGGEVGRV